MIVPMRSVDSVKARSHLCQTTKPVSDQIQQITIIDTGVGYLCGCVDMKSESTYYSGCV